jgi:hypothetical protein
MEEIICHLFPLSDECKKLNNIQECPVKKAKDGFSCRTIIEQTA